MINPIDTAYPLNDRMFDYNKQELTTLQLLSKIVPKVNEVVEESNQVDGKIAGKEDKSHLTNNRKLSPSGNFTGSISGKSSTMVISEISSNTDKIQYLNGQFSSGQTGLIVDGGFFEGSNIIKNYDGGVF